MLLLNSKKNKEGRIIKRFIINVLLLIIALVLQLTFPPDFIFKGVRPDFLLVIVVVIGLVSGSKKGIGYGFAAGMMQNILQGGFSGVFPLIKILVGGMSGLFGKNIFKDKFVFPPIAIFILTFIHETLVILLNEKLLFNIKYISALISLILPEALLNSVLCFILYCVYYKVCYLRGNYHE